MYSDYESFVGRPETNFVDNKEKSAMGGTLRCDQ